MSEQQREHVSALADGELDPELIGPTISALEASFELKDRWERYHLISAALRGEGVSPAYRTIAARVREQLTTEPVPLRTPPKAGLRRRHADRQAISSRGSTYAGIALAASAAFLVVYALPPLLTSHQVSPPNPTLAQISTSRDATPQPSTLTGAASGDGSTRLVQQVPEALKGSAPRWHAAEPRLEPKLDQLLINHQASFPVTGIKGLLPYATVVGYEAGR